MGLQPAMVLATFSAMMGDESIISYFNIILEFILFRFNMFLFPFRAILLQLQVILFQE